MELNSSLLCVLCEMCWVDTRKWLKGVEIRCGGALGVLGGCFASSVLGSVRSEGSGEELVPGLCAGCPALLPLSLF